MTELKSSTSRSLALLTDMYQLTMAYGYWRLGRADQQATFHLYFRQLPFGGGYAIAAGLEPALEYLENLRFDDSDLGYLATLTGHDGQSLFEPDFLDYLSNMRFSCDVDAIREGSVVFPNQPILRVTGPILQCQLVETPLLNLVNFQTLIATRAARICEAAGDDAVLEFGLRRAHGTDGGLSASRAAYVGGCAATSNLLAGKRYGIPVRGTHAHSWVMCFDSELEAFRGYAEVMPNNCVLLVDTYDTMSGIRHAITVANELRAAGKRLLGVRLDSGDLAWLSKQARKMLDEAGFQDVTIAASNDLDETIIESLKQQGSEIETWGVGTRLVTAFDQPALGGVFKLSAIQGESGEWIPRVKLSEQTIKTSNPGQLGVRRYRRDGQAVADMIYDQLQGEPDDTIVDPLDATRRRRLEDDLEVEELVHSVMTGGQRTAPAECLETIRDRAGTQLAEFHGGIRRRVNPHSYPVGLDKKLFDLKTRLILEARGFGDSSA
ncbi:MAG: nicotinate phosphoribosyltransferase [Pirellulaceae bacterium]